MKIGVPTEIKNNERRVGLTPEATADLVHHGHEIFVESGAGTGISATDDDYRAAGATIVPEAAGIFDTAEMIVKVKEPQAAERAMLRPDHTLFAYLHLAPDPEQTKDLIASGCTAIAYETVSGPNNTTPLLAPMSQVAGRLSIQAAARCLESPTGGRGLLMGGVPGVAPAHVVIIGGGVAGSNAALVAVGMGARVTVVDRSAAVLEALDNRFHSTITTRYGSPSTMDELLRDADAVIGAVYVKGARAPKLVSKEQLSIMKQGAVLVDISIDQGGCFETSHPTTHDEPTFTIDGVVHYCVANMPGAVARTSTYALNNVTAPFAAKLADMGPRDALLSDPALLDGLNVCGGAITDRAVAEAQGYDYVDPAAALA